MELRRELLDWLALIRADQQFRRQQHDPWRRMTLHNIPIAPIEELLMRWRGGSVWRGGPQLQSHHPPCPALDHFRGDCAVGDPARRMEHWMRWPLQRERLFWCGPLVSHFGHQLGEFGGRVLLASLDPRPGTLLFLHPDGERRVDELPPWQQSWLRHLNPTNKPIRIHGGGFRAKRLVVIPQQQRLGCPPTPAHLLALTARGRSLNQAPIDDLVVLSRARYAAAMDQRSMRGAVAGEAAFDAWLTRQGARVVYPETLPFEQQLRLLHNSRRLIVMEGSALHGLELIGRQPNKHVVVIARRPLWTGMDQPLSRRFPRLEWIDAVQELHWQEPANPRVKGIARLDWTMVLQRLNQSFGLPLQTDTIGQLSTASERQLRHLNATLPLQHRVCESADRQPQRAGGW